VPTRTLLAARRAPLIVGVLHSLFVEGDMALRSSVLCERLMRDMELLRAEGEDLAQAPQQAVAEWLAAGWVTRSLPAGAPEEVYELSAEALGAIRFVCGALRPRTATTESRLSMVMQQLTRLAEETDDNPATRLQALQAERERIDRAIQDVQRFGVKPLASERAIERVREIITLTEELVGDFRVVRDELDSLHRQLRQSLVENEGSRGDVLESLFAGIDLIAQSDPGRTFSAFWSLLLAQEQSATLQESLAAITGRAFASGLDPTERRFLLNLRTTLMSEGASVHDVMRSLKAFVQSREFLEQRRLHEVLRQATQAALAAKDVVRTRQRDFSLQLTSACATSA
jgi:hypothetical protein